MPNSFCKSNRLSYETGYNTTTHNPGNPLCLNQDSQDLRDYQDKRMTCEGPFAKVIVYPMKRNIYPQTQIL